MAADVYDDTHTRAARLLYTRTVERAGGAGGPFARRTYVCSGRSRFFVQTLATDRAQGHSRPRRARRRPDLSQRTLQWRARLFCFFFSYPLALESTPSTLHVIVSVFVSLSPLPSSTFFFFSLSLPLLLLLLLSRRCNNMLFSAYGHV